MATKPKKAAKPQPSAKSAPSVNKSVKAPVVAKPRTSSTSTTQPSTVNPSKAVPAKAQFKKNSNVVSAKAPVAAKVSAVKTVKPAAQKPQAKPVSKSGNGLVSVAKAVEKSAGGLKVLANKGDEAIRTALKDQFKNVPGVTIKETKASLTITKGPGRLKVLAKKDAAAQASKKETKAIIKAGVAKIVKKVAKAHAAAPVKKPGSDLAKRMMNVSLVSEAGPSSPPPWEDQFRPAPVVNTTHPVAPAASAAVKEVRAASAPQPQPSVGLSMNELMARTANAVIQPKSGPVVQKTEGGLNFASLIGNR